VNLDIDLDSVDWVLKTARSVRRRLDFEREIPLTVIEECIDIATQAPVALAGENWRFIVVTDPDTKTELAGLYSEVLINLTTSRGIEIKPTHQALIERLHKIPCMIFVCAIGSPGESIPQQIAFYGSILPAAWSFMLALRARDIGTTWTTLLSAEQDRVGRVLGLPEDVLQVVMFPAAYTKDAVMKVADRIPARELTYLNRWGIR
jgi:nitroreductase